MKTRLFKYYWAIVLLSLVGTFVLCDLDDHQGRHSLDLLTPGVTLLNNLTKDAGLLIDQAPAAWYLPCGVLAAVIFLVGIISRDSQRRLFFAGILTALVTQFFLIDRSWQSALFQLLGLSTSPTTVYLPVPVVGVIGYALSALLILRASTRGEALRLTSLQRDSHATFSMCDLALMVAIFVLGVLFRTYALNHITHGFDGELACYFAGATSLKGMFVANEGVQGPWAPLGILYYLPIYVTTKFFGTTLLAVRLSSALVGALTIPLLYVLVTKIAGKRAGILAALLFSLNCLHIGWSRTDVHPHGVTTWPTLLLCLALINAVQTKKLSWAGLVALLMGLSWHQYPSGQTAVVIPFLALGFYALNNRLSLGVTLRQGVLIASGVVLWILGLPFGRYLARGEFYFSNPFTLTGPRASWGGDGAPTSVVDKALFVLGESLTHTGDLIQGLFYKTAYMFHQEWVPLTERLTSRLVAWPVMALAMAGLFIILSQRKRIETAVLCGWMVASILPGILSAQAYAKRMSTLFPAIDSLAAMALAASFALLPHTTERWRRLLAQSAVVGGTALFIGYTNYIWFSGRFWQYGEPAEVAMARELRATIPAKTIIIADLDGGYEPSKLTFLLLDHLTAPENRPNLLSFYRPERFPEFVQDPFKAPSVLSTSWVYLWTKLRDQRQETIDFTGWQHVNFIILDTHHNRAMNADEIALATSRCAHPKVTRVESSENRPEWKMMSITSVLCDVADLK